LVAAAVVVAGYGLELVSGMSLFRKTLLSATKSNLGYLFMAGALILEVFTVWCLRSPKDVEMFAVILRLLGWTVILLLGSYMVWAVLHTDWSRLEASQVLALALGSLILIGLAGLPTFWAASQCRKFMDPQKT
jgi:hypothetical protein